MLFSSPNIPKNIKNTEKTAEKKLEKNEKKVYAFVAINMIVY